MKISLPVPIHVMTIERAFQRRIDFQTAWESLNVDYKFHFGYDAKYVTEETHPQCFPAGALRPLVDRCINLGFAELIDSLDKGLPGVLLIEDDWMPLCTGEELKAALQRCLDSPYGMIATQVPYIGAWNPHAKVDTDDGFFQTWKNQLPFGGCHFVRRDKWEFVSRKLRQFEQNGDGNYRWFTNFASLSKPLFQHATDPHDCKASYRRGGIKN